MNKELIKEIAGIVIDTNSFNDGRYAEMQINPDEARVQAELHSHLALDVFHIYEDGRITSLECDTETFKAYEKDISAEDVLRRLEKYAK